MATSRSSCRFLWGASVAAILLALCVQRTRWATAPTAFAADPLRILVMDPSPRGGAAGLAQRKYEGLAAFLEKRLGRPVEIASSRTFSNPRLAPPGHVDLAIGKLSVLRADARQAKLQIRTLAMLTGPDGKVTLTGLFIVRKDDPARKVEDLTGRKILFGPAGDDETHSAALAALEALALPLPDRPPTCPSCIAAATAVLERKADAAVISSHAMPLIERSGTVDKNSLRIVGRTDPVPSIAVVATRHVTAEQKQAIADALLDVRSHPELLKTIKSKDGFLPLPPIAADQEWTDWRGKGRAAICDSVPSRLPKTTRLLWARPLTGPGMSGLSVTASSVIVADKDKTRKLDIFRCLDADSGKETWRLTYPAEGEMEYSNSPRAQPLVHDGLVYLYGAFGDLHCVKLDTGEIVWKKNLVKEFGAKVPIWGTCGTPLRVDDKLIVSPGAKNASVAALDRRTGKVIWKTPGGAAGYGSFILATFGGVRQIIGHDAVSLNAWDPETGKVLWRVVPEYEGDFNVPTPIVFGDKLLVGTECNGTRLYAFTPTGRIQPKPVALNEDLMPETSTPVVLDDLVLGSCNKLVCLDAQDGLKTLWQNTDDPFCDYASFIAGNGHVLVTTFSGTLYLLKPRRDGFSCVSQLPLFDAVPEAERETWSHPALVGKRFYVRNARGVYCFLLE